MTRHYDKHTMLDKSEQKKVTTDNFGLRSEDAQEIIGRKPGFVEKWAIFIFTGIITVLLVAGWFVHYPDAVRVKTVLTTYRGPKDVGMGQTEGTVEIFVRNGQPVREGDIIVWIKSSSNLVEVLQLSTRLDSCVNLLSRGQYHNIPPLFNEHLVKLGILQMPYELFISTIENMNVAKEKTRFEQAVQEIKNNLDDWKRKYLVTAPISGNIYLSFPFLQNQWVDKEKIIGTIHPLTDRYYAKTFLSENDRKYIHSGMPVQIELDHWKYGYIKGVVNYISETSSDSGYMVFVSLDQKPARSCTITYREGLKGNVRITTGKTRLLQKFYYSIMNKMQIGGIGK